MFFSTSLLSFINSLVCGLFSAVLDGVKQCRVGLSLTQCFNDMKKVALNRISAKVSNGTFFCFSLMVGISPSPPPPSPRSRICSLHPLLRVVFGMEIGPCPRSSGARDLRTTQKGEEAETFYSSQVY